MRTGAAACLLFLVLHLSPSAFKICPAHDSWWSADALDHSGGRFSNNYWKKYGVAAKVHMSLIMPIPSCSFSVHSRASFVDCWPIPPRHRIFRPSQARAPYGSAMTEFTPHFAGSPFDDSLDVVLFLAELSSAVHCPLFQSMVSSSRHRPSDSPRNFLRESYLDVTVYSGYVYHSTSQGPSSSIDS
ncbi:hypothetical protein C8R44DRAFT_736594 [Mycena epipterygia]|nr:hypothetical protein C8R44DRAFT_736594 [Mycena epipterygia]